MSNQSQSKKKALQREQLHTSKSASYAAWIAAFAASVSCAISLIFFMECKKEREKKDEERIEVMISRENNFPVTITSENFYPSEFISIFMKITIVNNSDKDISIIDPIINLVQFFGPNGEFPRWTGPMFIEGFFYNNEKKIDQPINIKAGHGFRFYSKVRLPIAEKASKLIRQHYGNNTVPSMQELLGYLNSHDINLSGKKPGYYESHSWEGDIFQFSFKTGKGSQITKVVSWHTDDNILKGTAPDWLK